MAHILLVDDDPAMLTFLTTALEKVGHTITARENGLDALEQLRSDTAFDLLLTDVVMPGMDGLELSGEAGKLHPALKIMFITGFSAMVMDANGRKTANDNVMSKPFHLNDLVERVAKILAQ